MLADVAIVVAGLSSGHKIGLAAVGAAFIVFALVSSFVLPKRDPNFPGRSGLRWYLPLTVAFFAAMMAAVLVFGQEKKEARAEGGGEATTTATSPASTTPSSGGAAPTGDAAAGAIVFKKAGCVACHTLKAAGSTGTVGPNLDQKKPPAALILNRVENGKGPMPPFKKSLSQKQIHDVVAYVYKSTHP